MATTLRVKALKTALSEQGVKEQPPHSNWGPRVKQYLASVGLDFPAPWCMAFVHWCYAQNGKRLGGYGLVQAFDNWAQLNGYIVVRPRRGDILCYDWEPNNWDDHVGIVVRVLALRWRGGKFKGWVRTIEGNTSPDNDSNGGEVMIRYRWIETAKFARIPG